MGNHWDKLHIEEIACLSPHWENNWCLKNQKTVVAQMVKRLPAMQEAWVQSLGRKDPLEKEMATHSSTLPGKFHGWRILVGYSPWGHKESDVTKRLHMAEVQ